MVLRRKFPDRHRPYTVPGGTLGFYLLSSVVLIFLIVGAVSTIAPSVLNGIFGESYSFQDSWGVSGLRFELFTVGTLVVVVIIGLVGYVFAGSVRRDLRPIVEESVG